eukprot:8225543-Alexandrium_andersonii.AAC.1
MGSPLERKRQGANQPLELLGRILDRAIRLCFVGRRAFEHDLQAAFASAPACLLYTSPSPRD